MRNFTYTTRADGRLMKKVTRKGHTPKYLYADNEKDLKKQYDEFMHLSYIGVIDDSMKLRDFTPKWLNINSANKEFRHH